MKKKLLSLLTLLIVGISGAWADADGYRVGFDTSLDVSNAARRINSVKIGDVVKTLEDDNKMYRDLHETIIFEVVPGATLTPGFILNGGGWMHGLVYVDLNQNGDFATYDDDTFTLDEGENVANSASAGNLGSTFSCGSFTAPQTTGDYRMRFKVDWNGGDPRALNPAGRIGDNGTYASSDNNSIVKNSGSIVDVTLRVVSNVKTITFKFEGALSTTTTVDVPTGSVPTLPYTIPSYVNYTVSPDLAAANENATYTVTNSYNTEIMPFVPNSDKLYHLNINRNPNLKVYTEGDAIKTVAGTEITMENQTNFMWQFGGDWLNGFTLKNKATAKFVSFGDQGVNNTNNKKASLVAAIESGASFDLEKNGNYYFFKIHGSTSNYISNNGGTGTTEMTTWNSRDYNDGGSQFIISETFEMANVFYTLTDANHNQYQGIITTALNKTPEFAGAYGSTFTHEVWNGTSYSATIEFPFPVNISTGIQSELGNSKWYVNESGKVVANNESNTKIYSSDKDKYNWIIIPTATDGEFSFKIKNVKTGKYIPEAVSTSSGTATTLVDEVSAGSFYFCHIKTGNGFATSSSNNKFLTINSNGTNQNIWLWQFNGTAAHLGSNLTFPEIEATVDDEQINADFASLADLEKFVLEEGATVVGPSEFAAPAEINAAIDACNSVGDNIDAKIAFLNSENGTKLSTYKNSRDLYGSLDNVIINMKSTYGTLILSCPSSPVPGLAKYTCAGDNEGVLELTTSDGSYSQFVPYIIKKTGEQSKFQIIGWNKGPHENVTTGYLIGVLNAETKVPSGSFILSTKNDVQAFYRVDTDNYSAAVNKCYITTPEASEVRALYFQENGVMTNINDINLENNESIIYNLAGQKLNSLQKGINIVNGKKILVK